MSTFISASIQYLVGNMVHPHSTVFNNVCEGKLTFLGVCFGSACGEEVGKKVKLDFSASWFVLTHHICCKKMLVIYIYQAPIIILVEHKMYRIQKNVGKRRLQEK